MWGYNVRFWNQSLGIQVKGFPKLGAAFLGGPTIRLIRSILASVWGPLFGKYRITAQVHVDVADNPYRSQNRKAAVACCPESISCRLTGA